MKTPREILFERHRQIEPKLDVLREKTVAELGAAADGRITRASQTESPAVSGILRTVWLELIWPCRRAWAAMAVVWLGVAAANVAMKAPFSSAGMARSAPAPNMIQALDEQRRLLAELLPPVAATPAVKRTKPSGQPRSERPVFLKAC